eukprot:11195352-Lingulodinium_polyedra.AAC.1
MAELSGWHTEWRRCSRYPTVWPGQPLQTGGKRAGGRAPRWFQQGAAKSLLKRSRAKRAPT